MSERKWPRVVFEKPKKVNRLINRRIVREELMPEPTPSTNGHAENPNDNLWRRWGRHVDWRDKVQEEGVRKAFDLPGTDDMNSVRKEINYNGLGFKELAVIGLLTLGGIYLVTRDITPAPTPPPAVDTDTDTDSYTTVKFPE